MNKITNKFPYTGIFLAIILAAGVVVRLYKISNPIADWHSWRQADTSAVTRNYFKYGIDLFHPRYDDFSDVSGTGKFNPQGYRFVEFPLFNLLHYSLKSIFPALSLEVWGRLTTALCSIVSALLLFVIVRRYLGNPTAYLASIFFLFLPYSIYYSRTILPDPLMVTLVLAALNFFDLWIKTNSYKHFILSALFGAMSILVKPVAMFFLLPAAWQLINKYGFSIFRKLSSYVYLAILFVPFLIWRTWELRFPEGMPASWWLLNGNNIRFKGAFFQWIFGERMGSLILGKWGIFPVMTGVVASMSVSPYLLVWFVSSLLYLFTFATGNIQHDYYQIPIIPSLAVLLAIGTVKLWQGFWQKLLVVVCLAFMFAFSWYEIRGYYQINHWEIVHAGQAVDRVTPKDAKVVAPYLGDTAFLYQTNRAGFPFMTLPVKDMIDRYGITYYVSVNYDDETNLIMQKYTVVEKTPEYVIVKLVEPRHTLP